jgi:hypothetical protein
MNEANWDRIARAVIGVILGGLGFTSLEGVWQVVALVAGGILLVTGLVGWCPIYATFRFGTRKKSEQPVV